MLPQYTAALGGTERIKDLKDFLEGAYTTLKALEKKYSQVSDFKI